MRLYFHLSSGAGSILDDEGVEIEDLQVAVQDASDAIRGLHEDIVSCLPSSTGWDLRIVDENGKLIGFFVLGSSIHGGAALRKVRPLLRSKRG